MADRIAHRAPVSGRGPELTLVVVTLIWSCTFFATQTALRDATPFAVMGLRFGTGLLALAAASAPRLRGMTRDELRAGGTIGISFFLVHTCLTLGLQHIPSSRAAFIATLYVPLVPLFQLAFQGRRPSRATVAGIAVSFVGLVVMTTRHGGGLDLHFGRGEWLVLGNAGAMAAYVILVGGRRSGPAAGGTDAAAVALDPLRVAIVQVTVVLVLAAIAFVAAGEPVPHLTPSLAGATLFLGVLTTAFSTTAVAWAQRSVTPARAAMIYAMQAMWAGAIGVIAGEAVTLRAAIGSALILAGVVASGARGARGSEGPAEGDTQRSFSLSDVSGAMRRSVGK